MQEKHLSPVLEKETIEIRSEDQIKKLISDCTTSNSFKEYVRSTVGRVTFLTYADISKLLPLKQQTLYNHRSKGLLKSTLSLSRPVFDWSDVRRYAIKINLVEVNND